MGMDTNASAATVYGWAVGGVTEAAPQLPKCHTCGGAEYTDWIEHAASEVHHQAMADKKAAEERAETEAAEAEAVATQEAADALLRAGFIQCIGCGQQRRLDWFEPHGSNLCAICRDRALAGQKCPGPTVDGQCQEPIFANGMCSTHGQQMRRRGYMSVIRRKRSSNEELWGPRATRA
jgi:hypothetical protein